MRKASRFVLLRHDREGKIIPIAAFVVRLEVTAVGRENRAVRQIAKGAAYRCGGGVTDNGQDGAETQITSRCAGEVEAGGVLNDHTVRDHLIELHFSVPALVGTSVGSRNAKGKGALDGESGLLL